LLGGAGIAFVETRIGPRLSVALIAVIFVDVLTVNQLLDPLAYARGTFEELYGSTLVAFDKQLEGDQRLYGPPLTAVGYRNYALQSRVETTYGYNPLELQGYAEYADAAETNPQLVAGFAAPYRVTDGAQVQPSPGALPLAFFATRVVSIA